MSAVHVGLYVIVALTVPQTNSIVAAALSSILPLLVSVFGCVCVVGCNNTNIIIDTTTDFVKLKLNKILSVVKGVTDLNIPMFGDRKVPTVLITNDSRFLVGAKHVGYVLLSSERTTFPNMLIVKPIISTSAKQSRTTEPLFKVSEIVKMILVAVLRLFSLATPERIEDVCVTHGMLSMQFELQTVFNLKMFMTSFVSLCAITGFAFADYCTILCKIFEENLFDNTVFDVSSRDELVKRLNVTKIANGVLPSFWQNLLKLLLNPPQILSLTRARALFPNRLFVTWTLSTDLIKLLSITNYAYDALKTDLRRALLKVLCETRVSRWHSEMEDGIFICPDMLESCCNGFKTLLDMICGDRLNRFDLFLTAFELLQLYLDPVAHPDVLNCLIVPHNPNYSVPHPFVYHLIALAKRHFEQSTPADLVSFSQCVEQRICAFIEGGAIAPFLDLTVAHLEYYFKNVVAGQFHSLEKSLIEFRELCDKTILHTVSVTPLTQEKKKNTQSTFECVCGPQPISLRVENPETPNMCWFCVHCPDDTSRKLPRMSAIISMPECVKEHESKFYMEATSQKCKQCNSQFFCIRDTPLCHACYVGPLLPMYNCMCTDCGDTWNTIHCPTAVDWRCETCIKRSAFAPENSLEVELKVGPFLLKCPLFVQCVAGLVTTGRLHMKNMQCLNDGLELAAHVLNYLRDALPNMLITDLNVFELCCTLFEPFDKIITDISCVMCGEDIDHLLQVVTPCGRHECTITVCADCVKANNCLRKGERKGCAVLKCTCGNPWSGYMLTLTGMVGQDCLTGPEIAAEAESNTNIGSCDNCGTIELEQPQVGGACDPNGPSAPFMCEKCNTLCKSAIKHNEYQMIRFASPEQLRLFNQRLMKELEQTLPLGHLVRMHKCNCDILMPVSHEFNGGCGHMHCKKCGTHYCWMCMMHFNTANECSQHMTSEAEKVSRISDDEVRRLAWRKGIFNIPKGKLSPEFIATIVVHYSRRFPHYEEITRQTALANNQWTVIGTGGQTMIDLSMVDDTDDDDDDDNDDDNDIN